jgi:hypothetical protein
MTPLDTAPVRLDLNGPVFQAQLRALAREERVLALATLSRLRRLIWRQVFAEPPFGWEVLDGVTAPDGAAVYAMRLTPSRRGCLYRDGDFARVLTAGVG